MVGPLLPLILLSILPALNSLPATLPIAVLFHPEDDPLQLVALNYAVRHINMDTSILPGTELRPVIVNVSQTDSFSMGKKVCSLAREGIVAIFGPRASSTTGIVQSISETLEIPNLQTYSEVPEYPARCLINLHPTQETITKAMADVVKNFLHWQSFTVIYDTDEGLLRLQEVLKAHGPGDEPVTVRQFLPGDDQRQLLKEIYASQETHILLECATNRIVEVLKQAREVKMMGDYHSYFITSLDAHTLDLTEFQEGHTNITILRLVDPENIVVKSAVNIWKDWEQHYRRPINLSPETVPTEVALLHDAMFLYARSIHQLFTPDQQFSVSTLACDDDDTWAHGYAISSYMKIFEMEGMTGNIHFDEFGRRSDVRLDIVEFFAGEFKKVGWWQTGLGITRTQTETEKEAEIAKTLQTKTFIVSSRIGEPFLMHRPSEKDLNGNERYMGYSMDLITEIANQLNFQFEFRLVPNNKHAELVDDLENRRADLAICDLTITQKREQIIDFTMPFMNLGISILYSKPVKEEPRLFAFLDPFSIDVWIYVATAYLGVSILLFVLARISPGEWDNPHPCNPDPEELENNFNLLNCLWFSIGSLMGQGCDILPKMSPMEWTSPHPCKSDPAGGYLETKLTMSNCIWHNCGSIMQQGSDIAPQAVSTRMVAGMWWFFTLIMISSYTANLAAFLTLTRMDSTISSAEDLAKQYKIKYGTMEGGSTAGFFKNSNDSTYKRMWTVMSQTRPSVFVKNNEEGVERVRKAKGMYAFFMESISIEHQVERKCDLTQVGGLLDSKGYGIGLPLISVCNNLKYYWKDLCTSLHNQIRLTEIQQPYDSIEAEFKKYSPYRTVISGAVLKLQEKGMLEALKARWWKVRDGVSCSALEAESAKADSNELGLDNVGGVFVVLIAGTLAAFLMAILELLWNCRKIAVEEKISPCEALASELKFAVNCANANKPVRKKDESEEEEEEGGEGGPRFQKFNDKD